MRGSFPDCDTPPRVTFGLKLQNREAELAAVALDLDERVLVELAVVGHPPPRSREVRLLKASPVAAVPVVHELADCHAYLRA